MQAQVRAMLSARAVAERARGLDRRRNTERAVVAYCPVLNAPAEAALARDVDIVVHDPGRATAHTLRKAKERGVQCFDARIFRVEGGFQAHAPPHELVATAAAAADYVRERFPGLRISHMPHLPEEDPAARYFAAERGELWSCDGEGMPPRLVV